GRDLTIDPQPLFWYGRVLPEIAEVTAAGDQVRVVDRFQEHGDATRLVLAVTVHRHKHVVATLRREIEGRNQGGPVAAVLLVRDEVNARFRGQQIAGAVGRAVVDDEDFRAVAADLAKDVLQILRFVVDGDRGE